jgi:hypothetical protein
VQPLVHREYTKGD